MNSVNWKWIICALIAALICNDGLMAGFAAGKVPLAGQVVFVAPNGHDSASGSAAAPFRTLAGAQAAIRRLKSAGKFPLGGVKVLIKAGTYYLRKPLVFTAADSGLPQSPIRYVAAPDATVIVSGGQLLHLHWRPWKHGIMQAQVPAGLKTDQLWVNGQKQVLARYPAPNAQSKAPYHGAITDIFNRGFARRWGQIMGLLNDIHHHTSEAYYSAGNKWPPHVGTQLFAWPAAQAINSKYWKQWKHPQGGFIHALHPFGWGSIDFEIKRIHGRLMLVGGWQTNRPMGAMPHLGYLANFRSFLTMPGEWYLDSRTSRLYFYPPANLKLAGAAVEVARRRSLVEFQASSDHPVQFVMMRGITFEHTPRTFMLNREPIMRSDLTVYRGGAVLFQGAEHCGLVNCNLVDLGGNAVFLSNYNRDVSVRGCLIKNIGGSGVSFVGDPHAAQVPEYWGIRISRNHMNLTPGPKTNNFPKNCSVDDCLIHNIGQIEYSAVGVEIDLAEDITVRHCSIYNTPRAGINIGDGCWGGDKIEYCDVFNTVLHTGDNGAFNSWGRDRYWQSSIGAMIKQHPNFPFLDVIKPITLCNNRWQCARGWDIDLDDGSSNYRIYNNVCLQGGIKNRDGFRRIVYNNVIVNNTFYPQVWPQDCGEKFEHNIVMRPYRFVFMYHRDWVKAENYNLFPTVAILRKEQALGADPNSVAGNPMFVDPQSDDYDVKPGSPALKIGFKNFPMNEFGVTSPRLRAMAQTPVMRGVTAPSHPPKLIVTRHWNGGQIRKITDLAEQSVYGLPTPSGVLVSLAPSNSKLVKLGLRQRDVIMKVNGRRVTTAGQVIAAWHKLHQGQTMKVVVMRQQQCITLHIKR
jgi:hypothetical protein